MIESIVPVVIRLKAVLQERRPQLISPLMEYLRDMMKEYKSEVSSDVEFKEKNSILEQDLNPGH